MAFVVRSTTWGSSPGTSPALLRCW